MDRNTFAKLIKRRQWAYRTLLLTDDQKLNEAAKIVITDLKMYCNATRSNLNSDAIMMAAGEARRDVFNRIMTFLKQDYEDYSTLYEEDLFDD